MLINNGRDGTSAVLEYWSPRWHAWSLAPTFIFHEAPTAWLHSLAWLAVAFAAASALSRWRTRSPGGAALAAMGTFVAALAAIGFVVPRLPHDPPLPEASLDARASLPILEEFDSTVRPAAVRYDPLLVRIRARRFFRSARLGVAPGIRNDPQPLRVLHNGRFSLPPGRYHVEVEWIATLPQPASVSLQVGRIAPAWKTWTVRPEQGTAWQTEFELPVEAGFLGFRAGPDLEHAIGHLTITPSISGQSRSAARRAAGGDRLATRYGDRRSFDDARVALEADGSWVLGQRAARVTIVRNSDRAPLMLRVHSGPKPNRVTISMRGWEKTSGSSRPRCHRTSRCLTLSGVSSRSRCGRKTDSIPGTTTRPHRIRRFLGAWVAILGAGS